MELKLPELPERYEWRELESEVQIMAHNTRWTHEHRKITDKALDKELIGFIAKRGNEALIPQAWTDKGWEGEHACENLQQAVDMLYALFMLGECEHTLLEE